MHIKNTSSLFTTKTNPLLRSLIAIAWLILVFASVSAGCGKRVNIAAEEELQNATHATEVQYVDYPEFMNWNQFPIGTTVIRESEIAGPKGMSTETMTLKLVDKSQQSLTVQMQVKVVHPDSVIENPPFEIKHRAKVRTLHAADDLSLPRPDAQFLGEETLNVLGKDIAAEVYTWIDTVEAGPMQVKLWRSQAFPGRTLRRETQVTDTFGREVSSTQSIKFLDIPSAAERPTQTQAPTQTSGS